MQAKFIVIEGIEGAGKSTVIKHVVEYFVQQEINHILTREPGGTPLAEKIRELFKSEHNSEQVYGETEVLLLYAARLQLVNNIIKPALNDQQWVIGDRHNLSTIAYQSGGRGLDINYINNIKQLVLGDFNFDFCLYLDIDPELGLKRAANRGELDRMEQENLEFFHNIRDAYLKEAVKDDNIVVIDASRSEQEVKDAVITAIQEKYNI